jgi:hypothetical protein
MLLSEVVVAVLRVMVAVQKVAVVVLVAIALQLLASLLVEGLLPSLLWR